MTCIVAAIDRKGNVHMAADSLYLEGGDGAVHTDMPKIFHYQHFLVGISGSVGDAQHLIQWFNVNSYLFKEEDLADGTFTKQIRRWIDDRVNPSKDRDFTLLIASKRAQTLFTMDDDYCVLTHSKFISVGSGGQMALGIWRALQVFPPKPPIPMKTKLFKILELTAERIVTVRGPFIYERL